MRRPLGVRTVASWTPACSRKRSSWDTARGACKQRRILLGEKRMGRARGGKQEQAHGCHRTAEDEKQLHLSLAPRGSRLSTGAGSCWGERTVNRFHGDSRCSSRLVSALS